MAQLQITIVTGSTNLYQTAADTGSSGNLWYDKEDNRIKYSTFVNGPGIWSNTIPSINNLSSVLVGTQASALAFNSANAESWDGNSWSAETAMITSRAQHSGAGQQNAGLAFAGYINCTCTEEYNGSSWSAGGAMNAGRVNPTGAG